MTAISGATVQVKTMADDTLRITIDIEPRDAKAAFELFGTRGTPVAIAKLTQEAAQDHARKEVIEEAKGGPLSRLAAMWCKDEKFWEWCGKYEADGEVPDDFPTNEEEAANWIRITCDINSRSEIDGNEEAAERFHRLIRIPFSEWLKANS